MKALLLFLICTAGCSYRLDSMGSRRFEDFTPHDRRGLTPQSLVARLGPPLNVRQVGDKLWFFYSYREVVTRSLVLTYYLQLLHLRDEVGAEADLIVVFDADDRLLYTTVTEPEE